MSLNASSKPFVIDSTKDDAISINVIKILAYLVGQFCEAKVNKKHCLKGAQIEKYDRQKGVFGIWETVAVRSMCMIVCLILCVYSRRLPLSPSPKYGCWPVQGVWYKEKTS